MLMSGLSSCCDEEEDAMSMGRRKRRQETLFVATADLARSAGHPFYRKLNELLAEAELDRWIEDRCEPYYEAADKPGRESIPPGTYFRMLLVGYFEGLGSQRGIAWRCGDSRSLAEFLNYGPQEPTPDHSTLSITRKRLPSEVFDEVFQFVLKIADEKRLLSGKTVGVDSTTLEANAAMKSILRRDTGEDWREYVVRLMKEEGVVEAKDEPTYEEAGSLRAAVASAGRSPGRLRLRLRRLGRRAVPSRAVRHDVAVLGRDLLAGLPPRMHGGVPGRSQPGVPFLRRRAQEDSIRQWQDGRGPRDGAPHPASNSRVPAVAESLSLRAAVLPGPPGRREGTCRATARLRPGELLGSRARGPILGGAEPRACRALA
jgi:hypothetical protein